MADPEAQVRRIYEAWNGGDLRGSLASMREDVEYVNPPYAVEPGIRRGSDEFLAAVENFRASFTEIQYSIDSIETAGEDVIVLATFRGRGAISGAEVEGSRHHVWTMREGKVQRFRWFNSRAEALEAATPSRPLPPSTGAARR